MIVTLRGKFVANVVRHIKGEDVPYCIILTEDNETVNIKGVHAPADKKQFDDVSIPVKLSAYKDNIYVSYFK